MIFQNSTILRQSPFANEKELQAFFEAHLQEILGLDLIETEFAVGNFRPDTVAFDHENNAFCIIEYKNGENPGVVDQGYAYLQLLFERKADFLVKYNEKKQLNLRLNDINWSQSRIFFVATKYNKHQLYIINSSELPFEFLKVTRYENNIIDIDRIQTSSKKAFSPKNALAALHHDVDKQIKVYTEEDHLAKGSPESVSLYQKLKERILELGDIDIKAAKGYIAFKGRTNICDIEIQRHALNIGINMTKGELSDSQGITRDVSNIGTWTNGDYQAKITSEDDIDAVIPLIRQSLKVNGK